MGTGSPRRAAQLLAARPDLEIVDIRGNVGHPAGPRQGCRRKDDGGGRTAGRPRRRRPGRRRPGAPGPARHVTEFLDPAVMLPAPGQGALAVECRTADAADRPARAGRWRPIDDTDTRLAVTAERALLARLEAGCAAPIGALATRDGDTPVPGSGGLQPPTAPAPCAAPPPRRARPTTAPAPWASRWPRSCCARAPRTWRTWRCTDAPIQMPLTWRAAAPALAGLTRCLPAARTAPAAMAAELRGRGARAVAVPLIDFELPARHRRAGRRPAPAAAPGASTGSSSPASPPCGPWSRRCAALGVAAGIRRPPAPGCRRRRRQPAGPLEAWASTSTACPTGDHSARGLLAVWPRLSAARGPAPRVLLPQADIADPHAARRPGGPGWDVHAVTAYSTVDYPADPAACRCHPAGGAPACRNGPAGRAARRRDACRRRERRRRPAHAVVFTSPAPSRRFLRAGSRCRGHAPLLVAIGDSTAAADCAPPGSARRHRRGSPPRRARRLG